MILDTLTLTNQLIGLDDLFAKVLWALRGGIPVLLEGEAGTGKTELAKTVSHALERPFYRVDGDHDLTATKLQGWFDPPLVLEKGYNWDTFLPGPLAQAMLDGGIFFFNEVNRAPSECLNAVLSAMDERVLHVPRLGAINYRPGFVAIFTCNPLDNIGTNPLPRAFYDRCILLSTHHLPLPQAQAIVGARTGLEDARLVEVVCRIVEGTRIHPEVEAGGSVRNAIHLAKLLDAARHAGRDPLAEDILTELAQAVLVKNIRLRYDASKEVGTVVAEVVQIVLYGEVKKKRR